MADGALRNDSARTFAAIKLIDDAENVESLIKHLECYIKSYDFTYLMIAQFVNPAIVNPEDIMTVTNWPAELLERRSKLPNRFVRDPIAQHALGTKQPFLWSQARRSASDFGKKMIDQFRSFDLHDGIMFPCYSYETLPGGISLGADRIDLSPEQISLIDIVTMHAYIRASTLLGPFPYQEKTSLTDREVDIIYYAAAGKTNWEIGRILEISEFTVRDHLKKIATKLRTSNRAHTVAVAIAQGHISV